MANLNGFDASTVDPAVGFEPIPEGTYLVTIVESGFQDTKAGTGRYLKLQFKVAEGPYKGRPLFHNLNLENPSKKAVEIARGELSAICRAVGVLRPADSVELHNLPLAAKVVLRKREDNGELSNEIRKFSSRDDAISGPTTVKMPGAKQEDAPPWAK